MKTTKRMTRIRAGASAAIVAASAAGIAGGLGGLGGCVGYASYPPIGGDVALSDPNGWQMVELMGQALKWTMQRYPTRGPSAINLPAEMHATRVFGVIDVIDDPDVYPMNGQTWTLPTYHVSRIWVRGDRAEVDIHRPVSYISSPEGERIHQTLTIRLVGGRQNWRVRSSQAWTIGAVQTPDLNYIPIPEEEDAPAQDLVEAPADDS